MPVALTSRCACSTRRTTRKPSRRHATARSRTCRNVSQGAVLAIERDEWLRIDRIGMRLLGVEDLPRQRMAVPEHGRDRPW